MINFLHLSAILSLTSALCLQRNAKKMNGANISPSFYSFFIFFSIFVFVLLLLPSFLSFFLSYPFLFLFFFCSSFYPFSEECDLQQKFHIDNVKHLPKFYAHFLKARFLFKA